MPLAVPDRARRHGRAALRVVPALMILIAPILATADVPEVPAAEADRHVGRVARVCGRVASAAHIGSVQGAPTFLNFDQAYPNQVFTVVIWGSNRAKFERPPERMYDGRTICVTGEIETYKGRPQIEVTDPGQIELANSAAAGGTLTDEEAIFVKALLASLGHDVNYGDGAWDQHAVEALLSFQESEGLDPTGDPDPATLRALANAVPGIPDQDRTMVIRLLLFQIVRRWE